MKNNNEIIIGINPVFDALKFSDIITKIFVLKNIDISHNKNIAKIIKIARKKGIHIEYIDKHSIDSMSECKYHQGVAAKAKPFLYANLKEVIKSTRDLSKCLILILDHIKDAGNLGAIIRSAEACGAKAVIIPNKRCAEVKASTYKTSAGSVINIPIIQVSNISLAIEELKRNEFWVCCASEHAKDEIWDCNLQGKIAIVVGGEHEGVSPLVLKKSDFIAKLPITGRVESLNAAQACSVFCYEWIRQNR